MTDQKDKETNSSYTQVKTVYARTAIILLALNFCITGYVLANLMEIQAVQASESPAVETPSESATQPPSSESESSSKEE